jgi:hypothetical protein
MPPPLPYFKVNICPLPFPHFASIFFAYLWSFRWPNYIVDDHDDIVTHGRSREFRMHMKNPAQTRSGCIRFNVLIFHQATFAE